ncbi:helix-turn-helix domain-containing protein [Novosphingobium sp. G106]|uniref:helix-turn-helix domain-containing protein n=1 Tax=Novosphingobium sp. G106 TaxID=2849500 RepID=UPI001C2DA1E6|nr:helix-turn-helix domain-containing protein [Novosphingobium sp. G106]MBV1686460.1 helix-turn-helix domain-containing protein [Novosphingobium sp. G106]
MESSGLQVKYVERIFEILDYLADGTSIATVMGISRHFGRPQSSTSQILLTLVELGMIWRDPTRRTYHLSPRAALIGTFGQPAILRDGRVVRLVDRLVSLVGFPVAIVARNGINAQIVHWRPNQYMSQSTKGLRAGIQCRLCDATAGKLLLRAVSQPCREELVHQISSASDDSLLRAEGVAGPRIEISLEAKGQNDAMGFGSTAMMTGRVIPGHSPDHPFVVGFVHDSQEIPGEAYLVQLIDVAIDELVHEAEPVAYDEEGSEPEGYLQQRAS